MSSWTDKKNLDLLGVHVLTEYVYCQRAGVIASESHDQDTGFASHGRICLDFSPRYDLIELRRRYREISIYLKHMILAAVIGWMILLAAVVLFSPWWWFGFPIVLVWLVKAVYRETCELFALECGLRKAKAASYRDPHEPNARTQSDESVNWWLMREAGFEVLKPNSSLTSQQLGLKGTPWRILNRGGLWIPVFLRPNPRKRPLQKQHRIRIAAYCQLLEFNNCSSPYGIVMDAGSYDGVAIKHSHSSILALDDVLDKTYRLIISMRTLSVIPRAESENKCSNCPFARRRKHIPGLTETRLNGEPITPFHLDEAQRHCVCGDRFHWRPAAGR